MFTDHGKQLLLSRSEIDSSFYREKLNSHRRERLSIIRDNYVDAALLRVGTVRFRPAEFRISFASSKQDPHYCCGGTVTVRFCFSFSPRFSFSFLFFFHSSRERERSESWGCAKGVNRTTWLPRAMHCMHIESDSPNDLHSIFLEAKFCGSRFYRYITQLLEM